MVLIFILLLLVYITLKILFQTKNYLLHDGYHSPALFTKCSYWRVFLFLRRSDNSLFVFPDFSAAESIVFRSYRAGARVFNGREQFYTVQTGIKCDMKMNSGKPGIFINGIAFNCM